MFSFPDAARVLGVALEFPNPSAQALGASLDTRTLHAGDLFVALRGSRTDGHDFLEEAFWRRASGALVDEKIWVRDRERFHSAPRVFQNLLPVEDTEEALQRLAAWHRLQMKIRAVGITGSVGKTSTKEFLYYLLAKKYSVLANSGNFNNHLGLPLTLLKIRPEDEICVAELGASHIGEIRFLAGLLKPDLAILTQVSPAHLEGFGSLENVYEAKLELLASLEENSLAILPDDDPVLLKKASRFPLRRILVGETEAADVQISEVQVLNGHVHFKLKKGDRSLLHFGPVPFFERSFAFPSVAPFLARNAAMALAAAEVLGLSENEIPEVWEGLELPKGRFQDQIIAGGIRVIDDGYNASPASFQKALEAFAALEVAGRRMLVFADMLELGPEEKKFHEELGRAIARFPFDVVAAYGERSRVSVEAIRAENPKMRAEHFSGPEEIVSQLKGDLKLGDALLLKASRGMKIERVLEGLRREQRERANPKGAWPRLNLCSTSSTL